MKSVDPFKLCIGDRVKYSFPDAGWPHDQRLCEANFKIGQVLVVTKVNVRKWETFLFFEGYVPGFNSVMFSTI